MYGASLGIGLYAQSLTIDSVKVAFVSVIPQERAMALMTRVVVEEGFSLDFRRMGTFEAWTVKKAVLLRNETKGQLSLHVAVRVTQNLSQIILEATFEPATSRELLEKAADPAYRWLLIAGLKRYVELYLRGLKQAYLDKTLTIE